MDREITIRVSDEEAQRIDRRVADGKFASAEEFLHAAIASYESDEDFALPFGQMRRMIAESLSDARPPVGVAEVLAGLRARVDAKPRR